MALLIPPARPVTPDGELRPLADYRSLVRRHLPLLAATTLAGLVVGVVQVATTTREYRSHAAVFAPANPMYATDEAGVTPKLVTLDTEAEVLRSDRVTTVVRARLPYVDGAYLREHLAVTAPANTRILDLTVTDPDPARATAVTTAVAEAFLQIRSEVLQDRRSAQRVGVLNRVRDLQGRLRQAEGLTDAQLAERLNGTGDISAVAGNDDTLTPDQMVGQIQLLQAQLSTLEAGANAPGELVNVAGEAVPVGGSPEVPLTSWAMLGLLAGVLAVGARERTSMRFRSPGDLARATDHVGPPVAVLRDGQVAPADDRYWDEFVVPFEEVVGPGSVTVVTPLDAGVPSGAARAVVDRLYRHGASAELHVHDGADEGPQDLPAGEGDEPADHLVVAAAPLAQVLDSLWPTSADRFVLVAEAGRTPLRRLVRELDHLAGLRLEVAGVVLVHPARAGRLRARRR